MDMRIPEQFRGTLTEEEERELRDPDNWDWDSGEILEPVADPYLVFSVYLNRDAVVILGELARREGENPVDMVQRIVPERLLAERAAAGPGEDGLGASTDQE